MLGRQGIISPADADKIVHGLEEVLDEIEAGEFKWRTELEDVHMNIEARLVEKIGDAGRKLHTARSRNDQVALDIKLYLKDECAQVVNLIDAMQEALLEKAEGYIDIVMPGYTHLQRAQPVLFSHHMMAYYEMLERDSGRFSDALKRGDRMPLGSGALAGTGYPIDRAFVALMLSFQEPTQNSMDSVSDRDFNLEFLAASSILMMHLSRLSEETGPVVHRGIRLHRPAGQVLHRLVHHAPEEEPGRPGAGARQDRQGIWRPDGAPDGDEGPAACL